MTLRCSPQIGSYFGAELCSVDLNSDGRTDLLLIGAPLYLNQNQGGIVHIHQPTQLKTEIGHLTGEKGHEFGRFGSSIAGIRDVNGDGLTDVAVGAPLENGGRGCVYIFHGRDSNISPTYTQRVEGSSIDGKLRYFGRSIDGSLDLTGDNLTDISVGALDHLFILRSRPVLQLKVTVTFTPDNISPLDDGCSAPAAQGTPVTANVCFTIIKDIPDTLGNLNVKISYQLALDIARKIQRAELGSQRSGTQSVDTGRKEACVKTQINVKVQARSPVARWLEHQRTWVRFPAGAKPLPSFRTPHASVYPAGQ
uniref:Integrin alpha-D-like n=1 Tax=Callorhinchus milii TaxID=7868 RepID=A0A4W3GSQ8_CALMI